MHNKALDVEGNGDEQDNMGAEIPTAGVRSFVDGL
jgi:hypothetical protein